MDVGAAVHELGIDHQFAVQRDIGHDALHCGLDQGRAHACQRLLARVAMDDDLAHHRVVVGRHEIVGVDVRIDPHTGASGCMPGGDAARRGREFIGILGVDPALDGVPLDLDLALGKGQLEPGGHHDLGLDDVHAGHEFGHRVLNLHPRVHLNEVELAVFVEEFEGAGSTVTNLLARSDATLTDLLDQFARNARRWRLFDHLLVAPLHRAVALAEPDRILVLIGQHLDFYVAGVLQEFLHVDLRVAKSGARLGLGGLHRMDECGLGVHHPHAATAAAAGGLDDDRVTNRPRSALDHHRVVGQGAFRAWHARHARLDHGLLGRDLVAHDADGLGGRADELEAAFFNPLGKVGVFAQETIPGVDGLGIGDFGGRNDGRHVQVALSRRCRANANCLVGQLDIFGITIGLGVDHHRLDAHFSAGTLDAQRDFATVGNQYFFEHGVPWLDGPPAPAAAGPWPWWSAADITRSQAGVDRTQRPGRSHTAPG